MKPYKSLSGEHQYATSKVLEIISENTKTMSCFRLTFEKKNKVTSQTLLRRYTSKLGKKRLCPHIVNVSNYITKNKPHISTNSSF